MPFILRQTRSTKFHYIMIVKIFFQELIRKFRNVIITTKEIYISFGINKLRLGCLQIFHTVVDHLLSKTMKLIIYILMRKYFRPNSYIHIRRGNQNQNRMKNPSLDTKHVPHNSNHKKFNIYIYIFQ